MFSVHVKFKMFTKKFRIKSNSAIKGSDRRKLRSQVSQQFVQLSDEDVGQLIPNKEDMSVMKLYTHSGANLMLPGVVASSLPAVGKGDVCGINLVGNQAAVAIGVAHWSTEDMIASGMRGKGVLTLHTYGDQLWAYGDKSSPPEIPMEGVDPSLSTTTDDAQQVAGGAGECSMGDDLEGATQVADCSSGVNQLSLDVSDNGNDCEVEEVEEESMEEKIEKMDNLLMQCFLFSLKTSVKKSNLPLLASTFYAQHIQKCCPANKSLDIKKSSYKKLSKFLQIMNDRGLVEIKEHSKGVSSIVGIDKSHDDLRSFVVPEEFERLRAAAAVADEVAKQEETAHTYQPPEVIEMLGVTSAMLPIFQPSYKKGSWLVRNMVKEVVTQYIKENQLVDINDTSMIVLDPHLSDAILNKSEYITHLKWDQVFARFYEKMQAGYQVLFPGEAPCSKTVKKGRIQPINIKIEQKAGNKKVTLVNNLETFSIDPKQFSHEVQVGVATSTSVSSLPGKNAGVQVLVQGNKMDYIASLLIDKYGLPRKYISGIEKASKSAKKR
ncbi:eukaryotic translation initiation factor 2D-like isoform X2 [Anneissia japonica]|uniref:eukaryotic translation initiation factor 2D-like isoform X2 n=1 Tax=Anneissia japonica TaxID=1529436 RepID=UPI00142587AB|nr:eukaryotic translation initiation factor 2D-like isoform X2 [Anneissia japonica]